MGKFFHDIGEKRRHYRERLDTKIAYHLEFSESMSEEDLEAIKVIVRTEIEREYRLQAQKRFLVFFAGFLGLAVLLYAILH